MAKKNTQKKDSKSGKKTELKKHKRSDSSGKNQKGTGPREKK
jgi:hypothetical protein